MFTNSLIKFSGGRLKSQEPKSLFADPQMLLQSFAYKERPVSMTYDVLKRMSRADVIANAIINTRIAQVAQFAQVQQTKYDMGYRIKMRDREANASKSDKDKMRLLERMILHTSTVEKAYKRDDFETFIRKYVRDSMTYDQAGMEIINTQNNYPYEWYAIDSKTIRFALHPEELDMPPDIEDRDTYARRYASKLGYLDTDILGKETAYVQVYEGRIINEYTEEEMAFMIRNVDTDLNNNGYGTAELEILVHHVTSILFSEQYNRNFFKQGSAIKGIITAPLSVPDHLLEAFKREWHAQVSGVANAWRTPVVKGDKMGFINMHQNNRDMEWSEYQNYLIRVHGSVYAIDPYEFGFDLKGNVGPSQNAPLFESSNEAKVKWSKDRGLKPLLTSISKIINQNIIWRIDDRYELVFLGLDTRTQQETADLHVKEVEHYKTVNEIRAEEDLPALPPDIGDKILSPILKEEPKQQETKPAVKVLAKPKEGNSKKEGNDKGKMTKSVVPLSHRISPEKIMANPWRFVIEDD